MGIDSNVLDAIARICVYVTYIYNENAEYYSCGQQIKLWNETNEVKWMVFCATLLLLGYTRDWTTRVMRHILYVASQKRKTNCSNNLAIVPRATGVLLMHWSDYILSIYININFNIWFYIKDNELLLEMLP